jgi:hypothetical protein
MSVIARIGSDTRKRGPDSAKGAGPRSVLVGYTGLVRGKAISGLP